MNIREVAVEDLRPYPLNAKVHPEEQIVALAERVEKFGFLRPFVVTGDGEIVVGHALRLACQRLGIEAAPAIVLPPETPPEEIRALRLFDNRIAQTGYDLEKLQEEARELSEIVGFDFAETGFTAKEWDALILGPEASEAKTGAEELDPGSVEFENKCPKCGFEWDA